MGRSKRGRARLQAVVLACAYAFLLFAPVADAWRGHDAAGADTSVAVTAGPGTVLAGMPASAADLTCDLCALMAGALRRALAATTPAALAAPASAAAPPQAVAPRTTLVHFAPGPRAPPLA